jgi:hypothetical protein
MWVSVNDRLPPEDVIVLVKTDDKGGARNVRNLVLKKNLWFVPDMSMYVYFYPTHWFDDETKRTTASSEENNLKTNNKFKFFNRV